MKGQATTQIFSKEKGVTNIDLFANHYQPLPQVCSTGHGCGARVTDVAAVMNNDCPVNSSKQVAGQFHCQAYLSVYTSWKSAKTTS